MSLFSISMKSNRKFATTNGAIFRKNRVYTVFTDEKVQDLLSDLHLADSFFGLETGIAPEILADEEAGRAYLCGAFLANGSIRDPDSGNTSLRSAQSIWTMPKGLLRSCSSSC